MNILSLFSGAGGLDLGFVRAGYQISLAIEYDEQAAKSYRANFPSHNVWHRDIRDVSIQEITDAIGGGITGIIGGPPCQPWSVAGKRLGAFDKRDMIPEFLRIVDGIHPKFVLMENVRGLIAWNEGHYFQNILDRLEVMNYEVDWRVLDAANHGVPQHRHRVFITAFSLARTDS